jgi:hypothetical protein
MVCDGDDLLSLDGVCEGVRFLSENKNYVSYRGAFVNWSRKNNMYKEPSVTHDDIFERLNIISKYGNNSCWNDIMRTNVIRSFFDICSHSQTNDLQCFIRLNVLLPPMFGNTFKCTDKPFYYHMPGASMVQNKGIYSKFNRWYYNASFNTSVAIIVSAMSNAIYKRNNKNLETIRNIVSDKVVKFLLSGSRIKIKNGKITSRRRRKIEAEDYEEDFFELMEQIKRESKNYDKDFFKLICLNNRDFHLNDNLKLNLNADHNIDLVKECLGKI